MERVVGRVVTGVCESEGSGYKTYGAVTVRTWLFGLFGIVGEKRRLKRQRFCFFEGSAIEALFVSFHTPSIFFLSFAFSLTPCSPSFCLPCPALFYEFGKQYTWIGMYGGEIC